MYEVACGSLLVFFCDWCWTCRFHNDNYFFSTLAHRTAVYHRTNVTWSVNPFYQCSLPLWQSREALNSMFLENWERRVQTVWTYHQTETEEGTPHNVPVAVFVVLSLNRFVRPWRTPQAGSAESPWGTFRWYTHKLQWRIWWWQTCPSGTGPSATSSDLWERRQKRCNWYRRVSETHSA